MSRRVLYWLACLGLVALAGSFGVRALLERGYQTDLDRLLLKADVHDARFDALRHFVHANSQHAQDAEYESRVGHSRAVLDAVVDYAEGRRAEPPHVICGTRAHLLVALYRRLGYRARLVFLFDTDRDSVSAHTFADVFNPSTGKWESQDPTYDVYWQNVSSKERTSVFDSAEDIGGIEPCAPTRCGWAFVSNEGLPVDKVRDLADVVSIENKAENIQSTKLTSRAKLNRVLSFHGHTGRFCEIMRGRCDHAELTK